MRTQVWKGVFPSHLPVFPPARMLVLEEKGGTYGTTKQFSKASSRITDTACKKNKMILLNLHTLYFQGFSGTEWRIFQQLLYFYPEYAPIAHLLCVQFEQPISSETLKSSQEQNRKNLRGEIHSLQSNLTRMRRKLSQFDISVQCVSGRGYRLDFERATVSVEATGPSLSQEEISHMTSSREASPFLIGKAHS